MLFLFGGRNGPLVRVILGVILLVVGIVVHGGALLVAIGAVLIIWGGVTALQNERTRRRRIADSERTS